MIPKGLNSLNSNNPRQQVVMVDKQGYDKFPEGRNIFFCRMTPADKLRLMRGVPRKAVYIKECIKAFWKLNL